MSVCSSCGAEVVWKKTPAGKLMPIDVAESLTAGNIVIDGDECLVLGPLEVEMHAGHEPLFTSHFATCPNAVGHRKRAA